MVLYLGSYALGNNYDYRLSMLLFVVPQLLSWTRCSVLSRYAWSTLVLTLGALWLGGIVYLHPDSLPAVDELANWLLVLALPALAVATWPPLARRPMRDLEHHD